MRRAIKAMVDLVSADLTNRGLTESGLPPLSLGIDGSDGAILFGSEHVAEQSSAPRVVMELVGFGFAEPLSAMITGIDPATFKATPEILARWPARPLASIVARYKVHCWAVADAAIGSTQDPYADADATIELVCAVCRSLINVLPGATVEDGGGVPGSTDARGALLNRAGQSATFYFTSPIPVLDYSQQIVGLGVKPTFDPYLYVLNPDGTSEQGIPTP